MATGTIFSGEAYALRDEEVDSSFIASLVVWLTSTSARARALMAPKPVLKASDRYADCALRAMSDRDPILTAQPIEQSAETLTRMRRRDRRRERFDARRSSSAPRTAASASFFGLR